jgi:hypothetical protein
MQLTINGKEYELSFGVRFVREMDKTYWGRPCKGINFGMGVAKALAGSEVHTTAAVLSDVIYSATVPHLRKRPTANEVDDFIDSRRDRLRFAI